MIPKNLTYAVTLVWLLSTVLSGQNSVIDLKAQDVAALEREDARHDHNRFSAPINLDLAPASAPDTYAYENGEWVWSQTFTVPGAIGLGLFADQLAIPTGGRLLLTSRAGTKGPFTQADASSENRLFTDFLPGETVTITYRGPLPESAPFHYGVLTIFTALTAGRTLMIKGLVTPTPAT